MLKKSEEIEIYSINQSVMLIKWYILIHILAVSAVFLSSLFLFYKTLVLIVILLGLWMVLNRQMEFDKVVIRHRLKTGWDISFLEGIFDSIEVLPSTVITPYILILHFKITNQQKQTILILKDSLVAEKYRELMVSLKLFGLLKVDL
ncbi:MAG: hypothetical protein GQ475_03405 [Methylococcaceae bacterium]|nr:hypothetical protein [Methylococcaceae bacterium]